MMPMSMSLIQSSVIKQIWKKSGFRCAPSSPPKADSAYLDGGAPLATRGLCAARGVWRLYQTKFEIRDRDRGTLPVELLARKKELATTAPVTTNTRPLGGRTGYFDYFELEN